MKPYNTSVVLEDFHPQTQAFFKGKKVAVTGGSGFIGSHVVEQLVALGAEPVVITRQASPVFLADIKQRYDLEQRLCDLNDVSATKAALKGCEVVLQLAAQVAGIEYNAKHPATIFQNNMTAYFNTIKAATEHGVERFLVTSSACVYPRHCSIPTPEEEGLLGEPEPTNSGYGWAKRMEEVLGQQYAQEFGLSVAIARPYNAYGPRDDFEPATSHVIPALIRKALLTEDGVLPVWGDGSHSRSFLYVDDFARGLLEVAARYPEADPVNIGADEEVTIKDLAQMIATIVSKVRGVSIVPQFDDQGLTGQPRRKCDVQKCEKLLGYKAKVSLQRGLETTIKWVMSYENSFMYPDTQRAAVS